jgi:WD40 repeat protein
VKYRQTDTKVWATLLVFLSRLLCAISTHAQVDSAAQLSMFQIHPGPVQAESILLEGAALSPDGEQVAAAYFYRVSAGRPAVTALSVQIWNVGTQAPIASKQLSAGQASERNFAVEWRTFPDGFVQYCNNGLGIMVADPHGTLYYLNPQTLEILHATATNIGIDAISERVFCAANSPRAVLAAHGEVFDKGPYGNGLVRVYDLTSGTLVQEWDMTKDLYSFGDVAISPSGNEIAVSHVPTNSFGRSKAVQNLELFDVNTRKSTLQVKTGHLPGRITFAGETRVATDDTVMPQPFFPHPRIKLWDSSNGRLIREFGDPRNGARRFVGASSDGNVILGYIPKETTRTGGRDPSPNETLEQRFRLWDSGTGQTIVTSPPFLPNQHSVSRGHDEDLDPSLEVSDNGRAVIVFWKSPWWEITLVQIRIWILTRKKG